MEVVMMIDKGRMITIVVVWMIMRHARMMIIRS